MSPDETPQCSERLHEANTLHQQGRLAEAEPMYRRILESDPRQPDALHLLGLLLHQQDHNEEAVEFIQSALAVNGSAAGYYNSLGAVLKAQGKHEEAITHLQQALAINRELPTAWNNLADVFLQLHRIEEAKEALQKADPKLARQLIMIHLRKLLRASGLDKFDAVLDVADDLFPDDVELAAARLFRFHFDASLQPEDHTERYRRWAGKHFPATTVEQHPPAPHFQLRERERDQNKIRVAYVGTYLHFMFIQNVLRFHNRNQFDLFLLTDDNRLNAKALEGQVTVVTLSEIDPVAYCREQKIDIAVDMVGPIPFFNGMRQFTAFQKRLAPIQCNWIATTGTCGSKMIDYVIADAYIVEPAEETLYVEKIARLPEVIHCWTPSTESPDTNPLPARQNGFITFGSANRGFKLDNAQLGVWAEVLSRTPQSRFHFKGLHCSDPDFVSQAKTLFSEKGIHSERLTFEDFSPHPEFLEFYQKIDISLDTTPYNGTITTLESLWMGVPVITRTERTFVSRVTGSYLLCLNKEAWVADSHENYIQIACDLASNIDQLEIDRRTLRERLEMSTLCDGFKFMRQLETLYRKMLENGGRTNVTVDDPSAESSMLRTN